MKLKIILSLAVVALLSGCGPSRTEVPGINERDLARPGERVGTLPDGREVKRWEVYSPSGNYVHYIYVVENATSISTNRLESQGKTQVNKTDVVIVNGKEYVPAKK
jgi:uncharacterized protein YceK